MEVIFLGKKPFRYRFTSRSSPELWRWLVMSKTDWSWSAGPGGRQGHFKRRARRLAKR